MRLLLELARRMDRVSGALERGVAWLTLLMVLLAAWNAVARYLGRFVGVDLSSNAFIEGQWYLFSLVFLLGAAGALRHDAHVRVDVLYGRLTPRRKALVDVLGCLLLLLPFCAFAVVVSWEWVAHSIAGLESSPDPGGLPRYPLKAMVPLSFALLFLQGLSLLVQRAADLGADPGAAASADPGAEPAP